MKSVATLVTKSAPFALRSCTITPTSTTTRTLAASSRLTHTRLGRCGVPPVRPYYTTVGEFSSYKITTRITSPFPMSNIEYLRPVQMDTTPIFPREIVFLGGAPGSGKGTNSSYIAQLRQFSAPTIVVSDLLNNPACRLLKDHGIMVDDDFVFNALLKELEKPMYRKGVVVDGFPRTARQAEFLHRFYDDLAHSTPFPHPRMMFVMFDVDKNASIERQLSRGMEVIALNKARASNALPPLEVRATDTQVEAAKARYEVFLEQLNAVTELSKQFPLVVVDASSSIECVRSNIAEKMASLPAPLF